MLSSSVRTEGSMFSHPEPGKTRGFCERVIVCAHRLEYATFDDLLAIDEEFGLQKDRWQCLYSRYKCRLGSMVGGQVSN